MIQLLDVYKTGSESRVMIATIVYLSICLQCQHKSLTVGDLHHCSLLDFEERFIKWYQTADE